jgi:hypothetical protein
MHSSRSLAKRLAAIAALACAGPLAAATVLATSSPPAGAAGATAATSTPSCTTSGLSIWLYTPAGNGTAGGAYFYLEFTNLSGHACTLEGFPGVSAVNLAGHQVGSAAGRDTTHTLGLVKLANASGAAGLPPLLSGVTATAVLQVTDVGAFASLACRSVAAAGLRVYPPDQTASVVVPFPFDACSRTGPTYLNVEPLRKGIASDA